MKKLLIKCGCLSAILGLVACNTMFDQGSGSSQRVAMNQPTTVQGQTLAANNPGETEGQPVASGQMAGNLGGSMDSIDKSKLNHALDSPLGKSTSWTNQGSGTQYVVIPTRKVTINGNALCRIYKTTATRGQNRKETTGTACVGTDGSWYSVSG